MQAGTEGAELFPVATDKDTDLYRLFFCPAVLRCSSHNNQGRVCPLLSARLGWATLGEMRQN